MLRVAISHLKPGPQREAQKLYLLMHPELIKRQMQVKLIMLKRKR